MPNQNLIYQIGITLVKGIGNIIAKQILENPEHVSLIFTGKKQLLERIGLSQRLIAEIRRPEPLKRAEEEIGFMEKNKITPLFITDEAYPERLRGCADSPVMLYYRGNADLNTAKIISIVGTRSASQYGREMTEQLIAGFREKFPETLIVSGLAYGIDIFAHRAALREDMATVGILAHGLDRIYPSEHRNVAVEMIRKGGLLTDFISKTVPNRQNFVKRNRIIAGIADCTVIVESAEKGGALITAHIADAYNRDVFACPGKVFDKYSSGCNALIKRKKATMITSIQDIFKEMNWVADTETDSRQPVQRNLFAELTPEEKTVADLLAKAKRLQLNSLAIELDMPVGRLSGMLLEMEMKGAVYCRAGGVYCLSGS